MSASPTPVLLVGPPRSGSTWCSRVLGTAADTRVVHEPDNEAVEPYAILAKRTIGRLPVLHEGADVPERYERLWAHALAGGGEHPEDRRESWVQRLYEPVRHQTTEEGLDDATTWGSVRLAAASALARPLRPLSRPGTVVVKSVYATGALPWLTTRFDVRVVVQLKSPLNLAASLARRGWAPPLEKALPVERPEDVGRPLARWLPPDLVDAAPDESAPYHVRMGWQVGAYLAVLRAQAAANPQWVVSTHEDVAEDPTPSYRRLFERLSLTWTDETSDYLAASDVADTAAYGERREAAREQDKWQRLLSEDEAAQVRAGFAPFVPLVGQPERLGS